MSCIAITCQCLILEECLVWPRIKFQNQSCCVQISFSCGSQMYQKYIRVLICSDLYRQHISTSCPLWYHIHRPAISGLALTSAENVFSDWEECKSNSWRLGKPESIGNGLNHLTMRYINILPLTKFLLF